MKFNVFKYEEGEVVKTDHQMEISHVLFQDTHDGIMYSREVMDNFFSLMSEQRILNGPFDSFDMQTNDEGNLWGSDKCGRCIYILKDGEVIFELQESGGE